MADSAQPLRIANCSGFYGDRISAAKEMIEGGPIDFLTGDYLAELTMLILWKLKQKDDRRGFATTFLRQMEQVLGPALDKGVKIVSNAGGLNPGGLAAELRELCEKLGLKANIAHIEGDDLLPQLNDLQKAGNQLRHLDTNQPLSELQAAPLSANAYLGAWGIVEALDQKADIVICPRVTDASLVVGPAAWHYDWKTDDWDALSGAVVVGHILECGTQTSGGNYAFFKEVPGLEYPGFPIAEMSSDGSAVITKHPGTGGLVSVGTVTAQLLYEIDSPRYANADVVSRFDSIELEDVGPDRVRVSGVKGEPAPEQLKVCINYLGGFRNSMTLVLTGLDIDEKADLVKRTLLKTFDEGKDFDSLEFDLVRNTTEDPATNGEACSLLRVTAKSSNPQQVGRKFSSGIVEMALASYPGLFMTAPPVDGTPYGVYWPTLVPADVVQQEVVLEDGSRFKLSKDAPRGKQMEANIEPVPTVEAPSGPTKKVPLGTIIGARSGDKGGNANIGLWAKTNAGYAWIVSYLTIDRFRELLPEAAGMDVRRFEFPRMNAMNFVVVGLLGEGVSSSPRFDAQAKGLGEYLRARLVEIPESLLSDEA